MLVSLKREVRWGSCYVTKRNCFKKNEGQTWTGETPCRHFANISVKQFCSIWYKELDDYISPGGQTC